MYLTRAPPQTLLFSATWKTQSASDPVAVFARELLSQPVRVSVAQSKDTALCANEARQRPLLLAPSLCFILKTLVFIERCVGEW